MLIQPINTHIVKTSIKRKIQNTQISFEGNKNEYLYTEAENKESYISVLYKKVLEHIGKKKEDTPQSINGTKSSTRENTKQIQNTPNKKVISKSKDRLVEPTATTLQGQRIIDSAKNIQSLSIEIVETAKSEYFEATNNIEKINKNNQTLYTEKYSEPRINKNHLVEISDNESGEIYQGFFVADKNIENLFKLICSNKAQTKTIYTADYVLHPRTISIEQIDSDTIEEYVYDNSGKLKYYSIGSKDSTNQNRREQMYYDEQGQLIKYESENEVFNFTAGILTEASIKDSRNNHTLYKNQYGQLTEVK